MWDQIIGFLSNKLIGAGGLVAILGAIILPLLKAQPITALTSTRLERVLFTKERRASVKLAYFIVQWIISCTLATLFAFFLYTLNISFIVVTCIIIVASFTYMTLQYIVSTKKSLLDKHLSSGLNIIISVMFLLVHTATIFTALPSFFAGVASFSNFSADDKITAEFWIMMAIFFAVNCVVNLFLLLSARNTFKEFIKKFNKYISEGFYIVEANSDKKWYVFHPTDKDNILLGNKESAEEATEFRIIERKKVLEYTINYIRVPKVLEEPVEDREDYVI
ncbi:hypothetical protein NSQ29_01385 [Paenibacillus sp. FSL F4-0236]|uniref:hypothetical protein n=1 Tax=Paenibacillus sp. FSL F4-0236 TaxID=2954731 RepID=UPI0030F64383